MRTPINETRPSASSPGPATNVSPGGKVCAVSSSNRVLVTGASGFIGRALCRELLAEGFAVQGLCRKSSIPALLPEVEPIVCDLVDRESLTRTLERTRSDYVFHLAGFTRASQEIDTVATAFDVNLAPTVNLLTAVTRVGCKQVVLAGSLEQPDPWDPPASPYAASKAAGAMYARMFHQLYGTPAVVARIFMVYGPGQRDLRKLIPHTILSLLRREELKLSTGQREFDWVYIDDLARGLAAMIHRPGLSGETVDLGTGSVASVRAVVDTLVELVAPNAIPRFGAVPDRAATRVCSADAERSLSLLGWRAQTSLHQGLELTVRHFVEEHDRARARRRTRTMAAVTALGMFSLGTLRNAERWLEAAVPFAA